MELKLNKYHQKLVELCAQINQSFREVVTFTQETSFESSKFHSESEIENFSAFEAFDFVKQNALELIATRTSLANLSNTEKGTQEYQDCLQNLERQSRDHFSFRNQMFVQIDYLKNELERKQKELNNSEKYFNQELSKLQKEKTKLSKILRTLETTSPENTPRKDTERINKLEKSNYVLEKQVCKLNLEIQKVQSELEDTQTFFNGQVSKNNKTAEFYKKKYQEKCKEKTQLEKIATSRLKNRFSECFNIERFQKTTIQQKPRQKSDDLSKYRPRQSKTPPKTQLIIRKKSVKRQ